VQLNFITIGGINFFTDICR